MGKLLALVGSYVLSSFVVKLFAALGVTFVTYKALTPFITRALDNIQPSLSQLPSDLLNLMALSGMPEFFTIVCSALLTAATIRASRAFLGAVK